MATQTSTFESPLPLTLVSSIAAPTNAETVSESIAVSTPISSAFTQSLSASVASPIARVAKDETRICNEASSTIVPSNSIVESSHLTVLNNTVTSSDVVDAKSAQVHSDKVTTEVLQPTTSSHSHSQSSASAAVVTTAVTEAVDVAVMDSTDSTPHPAPILDMPNTTAMLSTKNTSPTQLLRHLKSLVETTGNNEKW